MKLKLWDVETGKEVATLKVIIFQNRNQFKNNLIENKKGHNGEIVYILRW